MKLLRLLNLALLFTTRLPGWPVKDYNEKELGQSGVFFPVIGLMVGLLLYGEYLLLANTNILATAILLTISEVLISGGLHLDGFMDTMDGVMSGTSGEKMLVIMADSNVGAHSVSMIIVLILSKIAFLITILPLQPLVLLLLPFIGRVIMLLSIITFPYAKKQGIGNIYKSNLKCSYAILILAVSFIVILYIQPYSIGAVIATLLTTYYFARNITAKITGLTGDVYGAIEELSEVFFLFYFFITYLIIGR